MNTLRSFFEKNGHRLWEGKHLVNCNFMITRLENYSDFSTRSLEQIKAADIYDFMDHLTDQGLTDSTINRYLACFSVFFSLAVEHEVLVAAPKVRWKKSKPSRPRFFTDDELTSLVGFLSKSKNPWMVDFVTLGLNTGMRLGEILSINNDRPKKTVGVVSPCGDFITLKHTKNGDERIVPINEPAKQALENLDMKPSGPYTHRRFYDTWNEARDELARNDEHYVFHVLRHTCATRLAMEFNVDSITLGRILGHRSPQTTAKYVHTKPASLKAIMSKLDSKLPDSMAV